MIVEKKISIDKYHLFLACLLYLSPFADALTGILVGKKIMSEAFMGSPSQIFRTLLFFFASSILRSQESYYKIILVTLWLISLEVLSLFLHGTPGGLITGIGFSYKILYAFMLFFLLDQMLKTGNIDHRELLIHFRNSGLLYCAIVFVSAAIGIDFPSYSEGTFGTKGLFASGNGLGVFVGATTIVANYYYFMTRKGRDLLIFGFMFVVLLMIGSKASFIFSLINIFSFFWLSGRLVKLGFFLFALTIFVAFNGTILAALQTVLEVALFRYENSDSIITFIFSGRDNYVADAFKEYNTNGILSLRVFLGGGAFLSFRDPSVTGLVYDTLETDLFDVFFMYGLVGVIAYMMVFITGFYYCFKSFNVIFFFAWFAVFLHSLVAGHVVFNGNSVLGVIVLLVLIKYNYLSSINKPVFEKKS